MPSYLILMKLTDQGVKAIKEMPERIEEGIEAWKKMGGKIFGFYVLMGEYDYAAIGEFPNDEVAATFSLKVSSRGNIKTTTIKAFTKDEFSEIVKKMP